MRDNIHPSCLRLILTATTLLAVAALLGGCFKRESLSEQQLDRYWYLSPDVASQSKPRQLEATGQFPQRLVIRRQDSLLLSTISVVRASHQLSGSNGTLEFSMSPALAEELADSFRRGRIALEDFKRDIKPGGKVDAEAWASSVAEALVMIEQASRLLISAAESNNDEDSAAQSVLNTAMGLFGSDGDKPLTDLSLQQRANLRQVLVNLTLRLSFASAAKQLPDGLTERVVSILLQADRPEQAKGPIEELVKSALNQAAVAPPEEQLPRVINRFMTFAPPALQMLENLARQWHKLDYIAMELRTWQDQTVVVLSSQVRQGQRLRIADAFIMQPAVQFSGKTSIMIVPSLDQIDKGLVQFDSNDEGLAELRFEGVGYLMARLLLGLPLQGGRLREIRFGSSAPQEGKEQLNVTVLLEGEGAARRLINYSQQQDVFFRRDAFAVREIATDKIRKFSYINGSQMYYLARPAKPQSAP